MSVSPAGHKAGFPSDLCGAEKQGCCSSHSAHRWRAAKSELPGVVFQEVAGEVACVSSIPWQHLAQL